MDEKTSARFPSDLAGRKHRSFPLFRLLGMLGLACLMFGYFSSPAAAQGISSTPHTSTSAYAIPQAATPQGWSTVRYAGVSLAVPASWPVYDLSTHAARCALFSTHAVYLGQQGTNAQCPAHALGQSEALQIEPLATASSVIAREATTTTTVAGVAAKINASSSVSHSFVVVLSQAGVVIHLSYGKSSTLARRILGTLHVSASKTSASSQTSTPKPAVMTPATEPSGVFQGGGFDACTAPSASAMAAWWPDSPYAAAGIYIGGANRACGDGNLSASWVSTVTSQGWSLMPFYVGLQAPCVDQGGLATIDPSQAASEGTQAADDAVNLAQGFGLGTGTQIINDMEAYNNSNSSCSQAVMTFLSAWTQELHAQNYLSGVYSSESSGIDDLINHIGSITEPDTIDFANWDGVATTSDSGIPSSDWANHQRIKQYEGGHNETYGGYTINIDCDQLDTTLYNGSGGSSGGGGIGVPPAPGATAAPTSIPSTEWWITTFANAPGYRGGWTQDGTLYAGTNYVYCAEWGGEVSDNSGNYNHWWFWTDLDTGGQGWVSAYYLSKWGNDQELDNNGNPIPSCPT